jgi:hypothetical protein
MFDPYDSGYNYGCEDFGISDPHNGNINESKIGKGKYVLAEYERIK